MNNLTKDKVVKGLWIGVVGVCLAIIFTWLYQVITRLGTPYNFDYGESWNVWIGNWWGHGGLRNIYYPFGEEPYYQTFYTPVHYLILGILFKILSPTLVVARMLPITAVVVSTIFVFLIVRKVTGNKWYGVIGSALFLSTPLTRTWSMFNYVDTLGVTFSLIGMYLVLRSNLKYSLLWAVIPFLLGIFTKQIFFMAPLSVIIYLLFLRRWKLLLLFSGFMLVGGISLIAIFQVLSGGNFISAIFDAPTVFKVYWQMTLYLAQVFFQDYWLLLILGLCSTLLVLVRKKERQEPYFLLVIYFLMALGLSLATCGKVGSWLGYFLDPIAVMTLLIPIFVWRVSKFSPGKITSVKILVNEKMYNMGSLGGKDLLMIAIPLLVVFQLINYPNYSTWTQPPKGIEEDYSTIISYIEELPPGTPVLSEDAYILLETGREPIWEPSYFSEAAKHAGLDQEPLLDKIESKEFGLIILEWDIETYYNWKPGIAGCVEWMPDYVRRFYSMGYLRMTDEMADAVLDNYQLKDKFYRTWVYEPKELLELETTP